MKKKLLNVALIALFLLGLVAGAGTLIAIPNQACEYQYYSDATRTTVVGFRGVYCNYTTGWGTVSAHYDKECLFDCYGDDGGIE